MMRGISSVAEAPGQQNQGPSRDADRGSVQRSPMHSATRYEYDQLDPLGAARHVLTA